MARYINKVWWLLIYIKDIGLQQEVVLDKKPGDRKKEAILEIAGMQIQLMSLGNLFELYEILRTNLMNNENKNDEINLILDKFVTVEDQNELPTYSDDLQDQYNTSFILLNENEKYLEKKVITNQDLNWLRRERGWNRKEFGNTDKWEQICHMIKDAMIARLYTIYKELHGEKKGLPINVYDKYLTIMSQQNGHWPNFFGTFSSREFKNNFVRSETASIEDEQDLSPLPVISH